VIPLLLSAAVAAGAARAAVLPFERGASLSAGLVEEVRALVVTALSFGYGMEIVTAGEVAGGLVVEGRVEEGANGYGVTLRMRFPEGGSTEVSDTAVGRGRLAAAVNRILESLAGLVSSPASRGEERDVVLVVDATGGMEDEIAELAAGFVVLDRRLSVSGASVRSAAVAYKDRFDRPRLRRRDFTVYPQAIAGFFDETRAGGGGDVPEDAIAGVRYALELPFREDARKILFLVTDAPPAERGERFVDVARGLGARGIRLVVIACEGMDEKTEAAYRQAARLAGGTLLPNVYYRRYRTGEGNRVAGLAGGRGYLLPPGVEPPRGEGHEPSDYPFAPERRFSTLAALEAYAAGALGEIEAVGPAENRVCDVIADYLRAGPATPVIGAAALSDGVHSVWVEVSDPESWRVLARAKREDKPVWAGGAVLPRSGTAARFTFRPGTLVVVPGPDRIAAPCRTTLNAIHLRPNDFVGTGIGPLDLWFVPARCLALVKAADSR
jgi:hypothetical protein